MLGNSRQNLSLLKPEIHNKTQQFVCALNTFCFENGGHTKIDFREVVDGDLRRQVARR